MNKKNKKNNEFIENIEDARDTLTRKLYTLSKDEDIHIDKAKLIKEMTSVIKDLDKIIKEGGDIQSTDGDMTTSLFEKSIIKEDDIHTDTE